MEIKKEKPYVLFSYVFLCVLLLGYLIVRSVNICLTHDESIVFSRIRFGNLIYFTANNHFFQTVLSYLFSRPFGFSEFFMRLPSIMGFVIYAFYLYRIYNEIAKNHLALFLSLPLLLLNPFMLDYFNLARGYGLAMTFFTASLFYRLKFEQDSSMFRYLRMAAVCNALCVYSNWAFLTAVLALHIAFFDFRLKKESFNRKWISAALLEFFLLLPAVIFIFKVSRAGGLYYGGEKNVFSDTLFSILDASYHTPLLNITGMISVIFMLTVIAGLILRGSSLLNRMKILIAALLILPTLLHLVAGMKFPIERAALYWPITLGMFVFFMTVQFSGLTRNAVSYMGLVLIVGLDLLSIYNFAINANPDHSVTWHFDTHDKDVIRIIEKETEKNRKYTIGVTWYFEPSLNYYRLTGNKQWLNPVTRDSLTHRYDFYYVADEDLKFVSNCLVELKRYDDTKTTLFRACPAGSTPGIRQENYTPVQVPVQ